MRASGTPYLRKFSNLTIQEILVIMWPYANPSAPQVNQCEIYSRTHFSLITASRINIMRPWTSSSFSERKIKVKLKHNLFIIYLNNVRLRWNYNIIIVFLQWWEHSPPINMTVFNPGINGKRGLSLICCWFSPFAPRGFLWVLRFSSLLKN